jgi:hypothetical protein
MPNDIIGINEQVRSERENFENELKTILNASENADVLLRALGSIAFQIHCPQYGYLQTAMGRAYSNINLAAYSRHSKQIREILSTLGYTENREVFVLTGGERAIFYKPSKDLLVDVFYEKLDFCHTIHLKNRLEMDSPTIPLAELLLEITQIVQIKEKDLVNIIMLLLEHPLGETDRETINIKLIARVCAEEWGLWYSTKMNLGKVKQFAQNYTQLTPEQKSKLESRINEILLRLYTEPKPLVWKVRDQMGDRVKWYKDVDEIG